jgi:hypothetical protein
LPSSSEDPSKTSRGVLNPSGFDWSPSDRADSSLDLAVIGADEATEGV